MPRKTNRWAKKAPRPRSYPPHLAHNSELAQQVRRALRRCRNWCHRCHAPRSRAGFEKQTVKVGGQEVQYLIRCSHARF